VLYATIGLASGWPPGTCCLALLANVFMSRNVFFVFYWQLLVLCFLVGKLLKILLISDMYDL